MAEESPPLAGAGRTQSIRRAFLVLEQLAAEPGATVAALARSTGLPRATVTRVLGSLADEGAAVRAGGGWRLGPRVAQLARAAEPPLADRAAPVLAGLAAELGETVMLAEPAGALGVRIAAEATGARMVGVGSWLGRTLEDPASGFVRLRLATLEPAARRRAVAGLRLVAHTRATLVDPDALLAELERIAAAGRAEVVDEYEDGLAGLAVALPGGALLAVYLPTARLDAGMRARTFAALDAAAQSLTGASETTSASSSSHTR